MDAENARSFDDRMAAENALIVREIEKAKAARSAAGMGFWRLVFVVAFGIIAANLISSGFGLLVRVLFP